MQPDANDIVVTTYSINENIFKGLYDVVLRSGFHGDGILGILSYIWSVYSIIAFIVSIVFIIGLIYAYIRYHEFGEIEHQFLHDEEHRWQELHGAHNHIENERWHSVQHHLASENPNDWKLAIIEADVLLERTLDKAGYSGATIGEKLKSASIRSFSTIEDAWQAHRVRNQIAHGGADFILTQKVAKETLIQYERVFKEFGVFDESHGGGHH